MKFASYGFMAGVAVLALGVQGAVRADQAETGLNRSESTSGPHKPGPKPGASGLAGAGTESRWCTNSRATADAEHLYDRNCPSSSAKMGADGAWQAQPPGGISSSTRNQ